MNTDTSEDLGAASKEIIHHKTILGKFSSVYPGVEVGEGICLTRNKKTEHKRWIVC